MMFSKGHGRVGVSVGAFLALVVGFVFLMGLNQSHSQAATRAPSPSASHTRKTTKMAPAQQVNADTFLGTVASLSGTVAAILGGFVLAALLNISSERNSMVELLSERGRSSDAASQRLDAQRKDNELSLARLLSAWLRAAYRYDDNAPSPEEARRRIASLGLDITASNLVSIADNYIAERKKADTAVRLSGRDIMENRDARSFDTWAARYSPDGLNVDLLRDAFERTVESVERQERLGSRSPGSIQGVIRDNLSRRADGLTNAEADIRLWFQGPEARAERRMQEDLAREEGMTAELANKLSTLRLPSHLGLGVAVFCFIIAIGVIYPLSLMPSTPASFTSLADLVIKWGVVAQMVAIISYILFVARGLRPRPAS